MRCRTSLRDVLGPATLGLPVFLGAVAVGAFSVHIALLSNTSWVSDFLSGKPLGTGDEMAAAKTLPKTDTAKAS
ncbi:MAG: light-harvesting protein [Myxococcota bacterium]